MSLYKPKKGENLRNLTLFSTFLPFLAYISLFKSKKFHAGFLMNARIKNGTTLAHPLLHLDGHLTRYVVGWFYGTGLWYGEFRTDYGPTLVRSHAPIRAVTV